MYTFAKIIGTLTLLSLSRKRLDRKRTQEEKGEQPEAMEVDDDPLSSLVKRPRPLHADRNEDEMDVGEYTEESERLRKEEEGDGEEGTGRESEGAGDLRKTIQQKRKRRDLKMRLGHSPRLVERHA